MLAITTSLISFSNAQSFYVDVTNVTSNPQVHLPSGYAHYPSYDYSGAGFSAGSGPFSPAGQGTYYTADGFLTGFTVEGLWESSWLDALHPDPDSGPHGGLGTIDILTPGGISGAVGLNAAIYGNQLPAAPLFTGDTNGHYLGIGAEPGSGSEFALWETSFVLTETTTLQFGYSWTPAGATLANGTELLPLNTIGMGAQFYVDNDTDYSNGIVFSEDSLLRTYNGAGNQAWFTETGTFNLAPGTYYWGFTATGDGPASYIGVEGISVVPVPEPSMTLFAITGAAMFAMRRHRAVKGKRE